MTQTIILLILLCLNIATSQVTEKIFNTVNNSQLLTASDYSVQVSNNIECALWCTSMYNCEAFNFGALSGTCRVITMEDTFDGLQGIDDLSWKLMELENSKIFFRISSVLIMCTLKKLKCRVLCRAPSWCIF